VSAHSQAGHNGHPGLSDEGKQDFLPATFWCGTWTLAKAKARFSELVARAQAGLQIITRKGKPSAVLVSAEEWARKTECKGILAEFLLASPLRCAHHELTASATCPVT
jgi:prevent-host-death family protein